MVELLKKSMSLGVYFVLFICMIGITAFFLAQVSDKLAYVYGMIKELKFKEVIKELLIVLLYVLLFFISISITSITIFILFSPKSL